MHLTCVCGLRTRLDADRECKAITNNKISYWMDDDALGFKYL